MDASLAATLGLGFVLGLHHAMDPDHVAAVSTFVSEDRSVARACLRGTFWGAGHTAALLAAGLGVAVFRLSIPARLERGLELAVALALVLLGGHVVRRALSGVSVHRHPHAHDGVVHRHLHVHAGDPHAHTHAHLRRVGARPFLMGLLHGLAGSAALTVLAVTTMPSITGVLAYIVVFGLGSTGGMLAVSGLMALPFALSARRSRGLARVLQGVAGAASIGAGVLLAVQVAAS